MKTPTQAVGQSRQEIAFYLHLSGSPRSADALGVDYPVVHAPPSPTIGEVLPEVGLGPVGHCVAKIDAVVAPIRRPNRILVVEDSRIVRDRLTTLIQGLVPEVEVDQVSEASEAVRLFHEREPVAVLLDIELPRSCGLDLLAGFKRERPICVVVVLTTYDFRELRQHCTALGADHFFNKASEFMKAIDVLVALMCSCERGRIA